MYAIHTIKLSTTVYMFNIGNKYAINITILKSIIVHT